MPPKKTSTTKASTAKDSTKKPRKLVTKKNLDDIANGPEDPVENTKERKVKQISQLEHAKRKSMWVGSKKIQTT